MLRGPETIDLPATCPTAGPAHVPRTQSARESATDSALMAQLLGEAADGRYEAALAIATGANPADAVVANARGVCLMRLGRYEEAVALYRSLVPSPGLSSTRTELSTHVKTNFATALLLAGHPDACLRVLQQNRVDSPRAKQLRGAIAQWEETLTFRQKLDWWTNRVAPWNRPVPIDFPAGEFELSREFTAVPLTICPTHLESPVEA